MSFGRLSIVLSTHSAHFEAVAFKGDLETNLAKIVSWGYEGVELAIRDPSLVKVDELVNTLLRYKLTVPAIGTGQAWGEERLSFTSPEVVIRKAAIARIKSHIALAKKIDSMVIIGLIRGITPPGQSKDQSIGYMMECLQECAATATVMGVKLALEPVNRYETDLVHTVVEGLEIIQQVGSPQLGLLLDTFHMNIEEPDISKSILQAGKNIFHFHVADSNRWYPGGGHIDFNTILHTLKSTSYEGWISGEFLPKPDSDTAALRNIENLKTLIF